GKSDPVVDNCITANARAINRPTFPAKATKNKRIIKNVKLTTTENQTRAKPFTTFIFKTNKENKEIINAWTIANTDNLTNLPENQVKAFAGMTAGCLKGTTKDKAKTPTNKASVIMYGAFASR